MKHSIRTSELMNYEQNSSNSNNYVPSPISSIPESFPSLMEDGISVTEFNSPKGKYLIK